MKKRFFTSLLLVVISSFLFAQNSGIVVYGEPTTLEYQFEAITGSNPASDKMLSEQHTASATSVVLPTLPFADPGYTANGSITVSVLDGICADPYTYAVYAYPVVGSGPGGSTPPNTTITGYIGFPQGNFAFNNAGYGSYTITVTATGDCNPPVNPVVLQVDLVSPPVPVPISQWSIFAAFALILGYSVFAFRRLF
jgi:hypothetical protein